jgi:hypothetical protein
MCLVLSVTNMYESGDYNRRKVHSLKTLSHCFLMSAQLFKKYPRGNYQQFPESGHKTCCMSEAAIQMLN